MILSLRSLSLLLLSVFILESCHRKIERDEGPDENGFESAYTEDGTLLQKTKHIQGDADRIVQDYYKNGQLFQEVHYVNYKKQGEVKKFYEDGKLYMVTSYDSGKLDGIEMKYRKDGTLSYEAPYLHDQPCLGLKEYLLDGTLKTKYPAIVITPIDKILLDEVYILRISLDDGTNSVEYFSGQLTDGKYIGSDAEPLYPVKKGILDIEYYVPVGGFVMKQLHLIAKIKTKQGNYYIAQRSFNLAVEN